MAYAAAQVIWATRQNRRVAAKMCPKRSEVMLRTGIIAAVICLGFFTVAAQEVKTDYDHNFNFSQVHTFAVKIGTSWGNQLSEDRAKNTVTQALTEKGWQPADETTADALVLLHGATETKKSLNTFYSGGYGGYGWGGWGGGMGTATTTESEYRVGTLVVDIFDAKTKKLIFRGVGQDELSDKPEKNTKKLEKGVAKIFKNFPPQAKETKESKGD